MLSRSLKAISIALVVAACSSGRDTSTRDTTTPESNAPDRPIAHDGTTARSSDSARTPKSVCTTLDYGHDRTNDDFYMHFESDEAALAYSRDFLAFSRMPEGTEVSYDGRLTRLLERVFAGFHAVFPRETAGLDTLPRMVLVRSPGLNAFTGFDERPEFDKAPWMFWVHDSAIGSSRPDAEIEGLFAHELAHLILRNFLPETRVKIRTHYRVPDGREQGILGAAMNDDPIVKARADELRLIGALVGRDHVFGALPMSGFEDTEYRLMLDELATQREASPAPRACTAADDGLRQLQRIYDRSVSAHDLTLRLDARDLEDVVGLRETTAASFSSCYAHVDMSLFELKVRSRVTVLSIPPERAEPLLELVLDETTEEHTLVYEALMSNEVERTFDALAGPTIDRLLDVVKSLHERSAVLEADPELPIDELRVFDLEEDADDAAVRVLKAIGSDPLGHVRLFVDHMRDPASCYRVVSGGIVPPYGRFIDPHNATCWRLFHAIEFSEALDRCSAEPARVAQTRSSAATNARPPKDPSIVRLLQPHRMRLR